MTKTRKKNDKTLNSKKQKTKKQIYTKENKTKSGDKEELELGNSRI